VSDASWTERWDELIAGGDSAAIEEFWMARLEEGVGDGSSFIEALKRMRSAGKKTLAATLLELAADQALADGAWEARKRFLVELIRLGLGDGEKWRSGLVECVRRLWAGSPSLEKLLAHFPLPAARKPLETLETIETWLAYDVGGVFAMAGRGPGRVVEANPQLGLLRLDFEREKRVPMPIDAARKYLTPLPAGHFLRRRIEEPAALAAAAASDPQGTLAAILESYAVPMAVPALKAALAGVVAEEQWTSWWNRAKKNPRVLASGSGTRVHYRLASGSGAEEEIRAEFAAAALPQQLDLVRRHGGRGRELAAFFGTALLERAAEEGTAPELVWEALMLAARTGAPAGAVEAARAAVLARVGPLALLGKLSDAQQREILLDFVRQHDAAGWAGVYEGWLDHEPSPRLLSTVATALVAAGESARVQSFLDRALLQPARHPSALVWLCEEDGEALRPLLEERRGGALLVRLVELAERRTFSPYRSRLKEILSAGGLAGRIVAERLTVDQARRIVQILEHPGILADERNWLRRAVTARFPELRQAPEADFVPALPATVNRLQLELKNLLEKEIPETLRAIQEARAHGDLSENFEYHAARARQEFLSARASELQGDLAKVRIIDPASVDTSRVRVGTRVWLRPQTGGEDRAIVILGPYEGDPEHGILSHGSEAAQLLLEKAVGDPVNFDGAAWSVDRIEPAL
jgi:transcription elongation GreA/GreB family factor